ncbi:MAG: hypothetical protein HYT79_10395 [Elusimicrobia bacterium]|nr:hypothetical protein [Elusimicrobiota bacterium]
MSRYLPSGNKFKRFGRDIFILSMCLASFAAAAAAIELGGSTILEVSARLSREMKDRIQVHLDKIFGYGKSEVFVHVDIGFSKEVKGDFEKTLKAYLSGEINRAAMQGASPQQSQGGGYQWLFPGLSAEGGSAGAGQSQSYILPGFTMQGFGGGTPPAAAPQGGGGGPQMMPGPGMPFADPNFLYAIGLEIKRIFVKVALDYSLPSDAETKVQALLGALLEVDPNRGDRIVITRFNMPNPIFELFKDSKFLSLVLQWATIAGLILAGLILISLLVVVTMRSLFNILGQWVEAFLAMRHRTMELKFDVPPWLREALPAIRFRKEEGSPDELDAQGAPKMIEAQTAEGPAGDLTINIPPERATELYHLIGKENPQHVAMVVAKLAPATRAAFLSSLPPDRLAQVFSALGQPQYVERDVLLRLKEELEHRIVGVVGGETEVVRTLESMALGFKMKLLKNLETQNAVLFRSVRKRILLFEDLMHVGDQELNVLLSKVPIQELTMAIADGLTSPALKEKIIRALPRKTAETLTELLSMTAKPPEEKIFEAQDKILRIAQKMIVDGTMHHPLAEASLEGK